MTALFMAILGMSATAGMVAGVVILIRLPLSKAPKIFSYALWAVVLFRLLCPFSFESAFSLIPPGPQVTPKAAPQDITYAEALEVPDDYVLMGDIFYPLMNRQSWPVNPPPNLNLTDGVSPANNVNTVGGIEQKNSANHSISWLDIATYVWLAGIAVLLGYALCSYLRLKRRLKTATLVEGNVYETDRIAMPFVLGFVKPKIYLPVSVANIEHILRHEQAHIRRGDCIIKPLAFLALCLHWFNPVIWLSYFLMCKDMEMSCDEAVLKSFDTDIRRDYSGSLLNFSIKQSRLFCPLAFGESNTKSRIKNVLAYKRPAVWVAAVSAVAVIVAATLLVANPQQTPALGGAAANNQPSNKPTVNETPQKPDFAGQTLSISATDYSYYYLLTAIDRFKAAYPDVEIVLHRYGLYDSAIYSQQVGAQLMAGEADDIIEARRLDIRKISERGLLADFYPLMQNDPYFNEEDYYMNVFDAIAYKGKLSVFPTSFMYNLIGINNLFSGHAAEQFNSYKTITGRQMLDLYNNLADKGGHYLCCSQDSQLLFYNGVYSFVDFENKKCYFNTPEFIQFLTDLKNSTSQKMSSHYKLDSDDSLDYRRELNNPGVLEEYALQYLFLPLDEFEYCEYLMFLPEAQKEFFTHFIPYTTDTNELSIYPGSSYGISEASQNKQLAWEFLKFITTPEANQNLSLFGMPVNRELVKNFAPSNMAWTINQFQSAGFTMDGEAADVVNQVMTMLEPYNEMPMKWYNGVDGKFFKDDFIAFLDGVLTAEQAASAMQSKVSLYLME